MVGSGVFYVRNVAAVILDGFLHLQTVTTVMSGGIVLVSCFVIAARGVPPRLPYGATVLPVSGIRFRHVINGFQFYNIKKHNNFSKLSLISQVLYTASPRRSQVSFPTIT